MPPRQRGGTRNQPIHRPDHSQPGPHEKAVMTDQQQTPSPDPDGEAPDRPLTLAVLRHLVREDWKSMPGDTLVVLS